jgi:hypothetical protein
MRWGQGAVWEKMKRLSPPSGRHNNSCSHNFIIFKYRINKPEKLNLKECNGYKDKTSLQVSRELHLCTRLSASG